mmetsp:Transcript_7395/g.24387  ORF Transcript_7395/g.24387 Transcript_7395/m.24387 type:complete len:218 (+) Transcript_7395:2270-2923(+)
MPFFTSPSSRRPRSFGIRIFRTSSSSRNVLTTFPVTTAIVEKITATNAKRDASPMNVPAIYEAESQPATVKTFRNLVVRSWTTCSATRPAVGMNAKIIMNAVAAFAGNDPRFPNSSWAFKMNAVNVQPIGRRTSGIVLKSRDAHKSRFRQRARIVADWRSQVPASEFSVATAAHASVVLANVPCCCCWEERRSPGSSSSSSSTRTLTSSVSSRRFLP